MLEQAGVAIIWYAHFTDDGEGKTGLSPTLTVYKDTSGTPEVNAQAMTELADGFYYYQQTPSGEGFRVAAAKTASSDVDQKHVPAVMLIGKAGIENLNATVSSRSSHGAPDLGNLDAKVSTRSSHGAADAAAAVVADAAFKRLLAFAGEYRRVTDITYDGAEVASATIKLYHSAAAFAADAPDATVNYTATLSGGRVTAHATEKQ